jgi:hypothetical protein
MDVLLDPLQSQMLIQDARVDCAFAVDLVRGNEAEGSELDIDQPVNRELLMWNLLGTEWKHQRRSCHLCP